MQTLGGLGLMAALVICYLLYFHSQPATGENGSDEGRPIAVASALPGHDELKTRPATHSVYKADLNRAHDAAHLMQTAHDEANSY